MVQVDIIPILYFLSRQLDQKKKFVNFHLCIFPALSDYFGEHNCFTALCSFLLYNEVNQLHVYPLPLEPPSSHPIPHPQVITEHRAVLPIL